MHTLSRLAIAVAGAILFCRGAPAAELTADRQSLDDAWWTGPLLAASASTLPQGHFLIEPYLYDAVSYARYDADGERRNQADVHTLGSQTYLLYGLLDNLSVGLIPRFGYTDVDGGRDSAGVRVGDLTLQGQYRLTQFSEDRRIPATSVVVQATAPVGKHDRLGERLSDGMGAGAWSTTLALYSQYYFWTPNGRILRTRLNIAHTFSDVADVRDVSVYGTDAGFRGRASPGDSFSVILAGEYSVTRNWVLALDLMFQHDASTAVMGETVSVVDGAVTREAVYERFPASRRIGVAPAVEYNFNSRVGVIVGARWFAAGRNVDASITPVAAINMVY